MCRDIPVNSIRLKCTSSDPNKGFNSFIKYWWFTSHNIEISVFAELTRLHLIWVEIGTDEKRHNYYLREVTWDSSWDLQIHKIFLYILNNAVSKLLTVYINFSLIEFKISVLFYFLTEIISLLIIHYIL